MIELSGEQRGGHFVVRVHGAAVELTDAPFGTLCCLVHDRLAGVTAGRMLERMAVKRLRRALDKGTRRKGTGRSLIRPVGKCKYVLAVAAEAIRIRLSIRDSFLTNCVPKEVADGLLAQCHCETSSEANDRQH